MSSTFGSSSSSLFSRSSSSSLGGLSAHFEPALKKVKYDGDHAQNSKATRWRFWKWIPPMGARPVCGTDDYGQLMASFKEHLTASSTFLYQINELRHFAKLELSPILGYVNLDSSSEEEKENVSVGSSSPTLATSVRGYYIFKDGIWPLWEDEYNAAGGCWTFRHSVLRGNDGEEPSVMWKKLILTLSDPKMTPFLESGEICGAGLTVRETARGWTYKFSIWNGNSDNTITKMMIGATLKSVVSLPGRLYYYSHRTNMHKQVHNPQQLKRKNSSSSSLNLGNRSGRFSFSSGAVTPIASKKSVTFLEHQGQQFQI